MRAWSVTLATASIALVASTALVTTSAYADRAKIVALAPASDARKAVAIGPEGQVYEPDGKGAWIRTRAGGVSEEVVGATRSGNTVICGAKKSPLFKLAKSGWTSVHLTHKSTAIVGAGSRALAAAGKSIFALDKSQPTKLGDSPAQVLSLAGSANGVVIATAKGLMKLEGGTFKPIKKAPKQVDALLSDRFALAGRGVIDLKSLKKTAWPSGVRVGEAIALGDTVHAVGTHGKQVELFSVKAGKLKREPIPLPDPKPITGLVVDSAGRVVVAVRDGRLAIREGSTWSVTAVRDELPDAKPGPAPAAQPQ